MVPDALTSICSLTVSILIREVVEILCKMEVDQWSRRLKKLLKGTKNPSSVSLGCYGGRGFLLPSTSVRTKIWKSILPKEQNLFKSLEMQAGIFFYILSLTVLRRKTVNG